MELNAFLIVRLQYGLFVSEADLIRKKMQDRLRQLGFRFMGYKGSRETIGLWTPRMKIFLIRFNGLYRLLIA